MRKNYLIFTILMIMVLSGCSNNKQSIVVTRVKYLNKTEVVKTIKKKSDVKKINTILENEIWHPAGFDENSNVDYKLNDQYDVSVHPDHSLTVFRYKDNVIESASINFEDANTLYKIMTDSDWE